MIGHDRSPNCVRRRLDSALVWDCKKIAPCADVDYGRIYDAEPAGAGRYGPEGYSLRVNRHCRRTILEKYRDQHLRKAGPHDTRVHAPSHRPDLRFSKKVEKHKAAPALNFARNSVVSLHKTLRVMPVRMADVALQFLVFDRNGQCNFKLGLTLCGKSLI